MMTPDEFDESLRLRGLVPQMRAAAALGVNQASISRWRTGKERVPRTVELALLAIPFAQGPVTVRSQRTSRTPRKSSNGGA